MTTEGTRVTISKMLNGLAKDQVTKAAQAWAAGDIPTWKSEVSTIRAVLDDAERCLKNDLWRNQ